jgi:probable rRNA maturation factor
MKMMCELGLAGAELSVALVDDPTISELNRAYRKKARPTDVLSFPQSEIDLRTGPMTRPAGLLGDVIISVPTARRQARRRRRPLLDEITTLLAHGLLHLVGFDHHTDAEERQMNERARQLEASAVRRGRSLTMCQTVPEKVKILRNP